MRENSEVVIIYPGVEDLHSEKHGAGFFGSIPQLNDGMMECRCACSGLGMSGPKPDLELGFHQQKKWTPSSSHRLFHAFFLNVLSADVSGDE